MMIALAYSVAFCRLASSRSVPVRQTAIALAVNFLIVHLPMPYVDPGDACMVLYVMAILGMLAWRIGWLDGRLLALGIVAMAVNQVFAFMSDNGREIWWIGMAALGGALVSRRTGWLAGLVSAVVLVNQAFVAVPLFWIAAPLDFRLRARNCLPAVSDGTSDQRPTA